MTTYVKGEYFVFSPGIFKLIKFILSVSRQAAYIAHAGNVWNS